MTFEEMEKSMTVFYSKQTGEIEYIATGIQSMDYFGQKKVDFEIIYDLIIVEKDSYVLDNTNKFNIVEGKIKLKPVKDEIDLSKYE